jgi:hypothetical protein
LLFFSLHLVNTFALLLLLLSILTLPFSLIMAAQNKSAGRLTIKAVAAILVLIPFLVLPTYGQQDSSCVTTYDPTHDYFPDKSQGNQPLFTTRFRRNSVNRMSLTKHLASLSHLPPSS